MRYALALVCACVLALTPFALADAGQQPTPVPESTPATPTPAPPCKARCRLKRDHRKLRRATPREPIPTYITDCESGGNTHALNTSGSGAGGRYQIMPTTWAANLPARRITRIAEYLTPAQARHRRHRYGRVDRGPRWSSRLLQDIVAGAIYADQGPAPWSCA